MVLALFVSSELVVTVIDVELEIYPEKMHSFGRFQVVTEHCIFQLRQSLWLGSFYQNYRQMRLKLCWREWLLKGLCYRERISGNL